MTDKKQSENLINIIDQRHLFGIKEPKDIRFAIKAVSKILHYQNRGYPLLRRAPQIVEKPKLYSGDLALYAHEDDTEKLTTLFNKEKDVFDYCVSKKLKRKFVSNKEALKKMSLGSRFTDKLYLHAKDYIQRQIKEPDLPICVEEADIHHNQKKPYIFLEKNLKIFKDDFLASKHATKFLKTPDKKNNDLGALDLLKKLGYDLSNNNNKIIREFLQSLYGQNSPIVEYKKVSKLIAALYVSERNFDQFQEELLDYNISFENNSSYEDKKEDDLNTTEILDELGCQTSAKNRKNLSYFLKELHKEEPKLAEKRLIRGKRDRVVNRVICVSRTKLDLLQKKIEVNDLSLSKKCLTKKKSDDLNAVQLLKELGYSATSNNKKVIRNFLKDLNIIKPDLAEKKQSNSNIAIFVNENKLDQFQKELIENKIDLKRKFVEKDKELTFKLVI